jgi:hypothetical protein
LSAVNVETLQDGIILVDPRLVFLERAAARLLLVKAGEMDLDEAIDGLVDAFDELTGRHCTCAQQTLAHWEIMFPPQIQGRL